jgi:hypothetical protein
MQNNSVYILFYKRKPATKFDFLDTWKQKLVDTPTIEDTVKITEETDAQKLQKDLDHKARIQLMDEVQ